MRIQITVPDPVIDEAKKQQVNLSDVCTKAIREALLAGAMEGPALTIAKQLAKINGHPTSYRDYIWTAKSLVQALEREGHFGTG